MSDHYVDHDDLALAADLLALYGREVDAHGGKGGRIPPAVRDLVHDAVDRDRAVETILAVLVVFTGTWPGALAADSTQETLTLTALQLREGLGELGAPMGEHRGGER